MGKPTEICPGVACLQSGAGTGWKCFNRWALCYFWSSHLILSPPQGHKHDHMGFPSPEKSLCTAPVVRKPGKLRSCLALSQEGGSFALSSGTKTMMAKPWQPHRQCKRWGILHLNSSPSTYPEEHSTSPISHFLTLPWQQMPSLLFSALPQQQIHPPATTPALSLHTESASAPLLIQPLPPCPTGEMQQEPMLSLQGSSLAAPCVNFPTKRQKNEQHNLETGS